MIKQNVCIYFFPSDIRHKATITRYFNGDEKKIILTKVTDISSKHSLKEQKTDIT